MAYDQLKDLTDSECRSRHRTSSARSEKLSLVFWLLAAGAAYLLGASGWLALAVAVFGIAMSLAPSMLSSTGTYAVAPAEIQDHLLRESPGAQEVAAYAKARGRAVRMFDVDEMERRFQLELTGAVFVAT